MTEGALEILETSTSRIFLKRKKKLTKLVFWNISSFAKTVTKCHHIILKNNIKGHSQGYDQRKQIL